MAIRSGERRYAGSGMAAGGAIADTLDIRMYCRRRRQPYPRSNRPRPQAGSLRF